MSATPNVPVLKPVASAPMTPWSIPPYRPSKIVPYLSIRKLYAMSQ